MVAKIKGAITCLSLMFNSDHGDHGFKEECVVPSGKEHHGIMILSLTHVLIPRSKLLPV